MGLKSLIIVSNPSQIQAIFRASKQLNSKPGVLFALKFLLNSPSRAFPLYEADDSGMATTPSKRSKVTPANRIHFHQARAAQKFLSSQHLTFAVGKYVHTLERNLQSLETHDTNGWVEYPDLYTFLQNLVFRTAVETLMGSKVLEMNPRLVDDFWIFDSNIPWFSRGLPRWFMPSAYQARDRLLEGIKEWHAYAHTSSDCTKIGDEDPEWEPYFGTKLVRARQDHALKMELMDADARASEDLGLLMA